MRAHLLLLYFIRVPAIHYPAPNPPLVLGVRLLESLKGPCHCDGGVNWSLRWQLVTSAVYWTATLLPNYSWLACCSKRKTTVSTWAWSSATSPFLLWFSVHCDFSIFFPSVISQHSTGIFISQMNFFVKIYSKKFHWKPFQENLILTVRFSSQPQFSYGFDFFFLLMFLPQFKVGKWSFEKGS